MAERRRRILITVPSSRTCVRSVREIRGDLRAVLQGVDEKDDFVIVTYKQEPIVVMMSPERYMRLTRHARQESNRRVERKTLYDGAAAGTVKLSPDCHYIRATVPSSSPQPHPPEKIPVPRSSHLADQMTTR
jgi:PHD/YefM family antitoxin component YafN of YafNO toxin-antitoxin module